MLELLYAVSALLFVVVSSAPGNIKHGQRDKSGPEFWNEQARLTVEAALKTRHVDGVAKNVIFFLGDGMSLATVTASRILKGQKKEGYLGEEEQLSWEKFNNVALMKTYNVDRQVPDSAGTATAYLCGVKTNYETVGVDERAKLADCDSLEGTQVTSILEWSQNEGKLTGFITTARVTHASPAGLYAHSVSRYWESDVEKSKSPGSENCKDIARQLVEDVPGVNINLIMGGGRSFFLPNDTVDQLTGNSGVRRDNRNLVDDWVQSKEKCNGTYKYITDSEEFEEWDPKETDFVLGLFGWSHMEYEVDRLKGPKGEPTIAEMTKKAIQMLSKGPKGYFLFVEGGRIDHAHHENFALRALEDAVAMDAAVQMAVDMTSEQETLIIVTADHSHVMTINGYPVRGNPILGIADVSDMDLLPYTTLMYTNGKGYERTPNGTRPNLTYVDTEHKNYRPMTAVPVKDETHGGDDVPLYARGPMAHLFYGVQEQNYIPHALAYASCVGKDKRNCWYREGPDEEVKTDGGGSNGGGVLSRTAHNVLVLVSVLSLCSKYYVAYFY